MMKNFKIFVLAYFITLLGLFALNAQTNTPDSLVNLALNAKLSGSIVNGRGIPSDIIYNLNTDKFLTPSTHEEYGVSYKATINANEFTYSMQWDEPILVNYITFAGSYENQPQPNTGWKISVLVDGEFQVLDEGVGGWVNNGIFEWKSENLQPIKIDAIVFEVTTTSKSFHLRGRKDSDIKAVLVQLLPYEIMEPEPTDVALELKQALTTLQKALETVQIELVKIKTETILNKKKNEVLQNRLDSLNNQ